MGQWVGVGLVFGGVGAEGVVQRSEKKSKEKAKAAAAVAAAIEDEKKGM